MATKEFPTLDVIGAATGVLLSDISGIYAVLSFASGESVFTHQLPRVGREFSRSMSAHYDWFDAINVRAQGVNRSNYKAFSDAVIAELGPTVPVHPMNANEHERIDPLSELSESLHPDRIIVADPAP